MTNETTVRDAALKTARAKHVTEHYQSRSTRDIMVDHPKREQTTEEPQIMIDYEDGTISIYGIRYTLDLFKHMGLGAIGNRFEITDRGDGVVTLTAIDLDRRVSKEDVAFDYSFLLPGMMKTEISREQLKQAMLAAADTPEGEAKLLAILEGATQKNE